ncbi:MAG: hypothetical protein DWI57_07845 [Chloroflexi bacterium]|nr:MAG: hypothetical protein DWI57_07845 [Chloroflexota bacterium]
MKLCRCSAACGMPLKATPASFSNNFSNSSGGSIECPTLLQIKALPSV